jgi:hypothetical protein
MKSNDNNENLNTNSNFGKQDKNILDPSQMIRNQEPILE